MCVLKAVMYLLLLLATAALLLLFEVLEELFDRRAPFLQNLLHLWLRPSAASMCALKLLVYAAEWYYYRRH